MSDPDGPTVTTLWPVPPDSPLLAAVGVRIVEGEMIRRVPAWDGRPVTLPVGLPPLVLLAGRTFSRAMLERRALFQQVTGWVPGEAAHAVPGVAPPVAPPASVEDRLAALYAGRAAAVAADADIAALTQVWRSDPVAEETAALTAFFDQLADTVDPDWRDRDRDDLVAATAWARVEAQTLAGDRLFGRRRGGPGWSVLSALVWRLAEGKRRRWG